MRDEKGKNRQGISTGRRPFRRKFFSARPALLLRVQQRYVGKEEKKRNNEDKQKDKKIERKQKKEKLSDRRNDVT